MHFCLVAFIFSWLTFGIVPFVWMIKLTARVGNELRRFELIDGEIGSDEINHVSGRGRV